MLSEAKSLITAQRGPSGSSPLTLFRGKIRKGDVEVNGVDESEPIRLPQVSVAVIQGTEELWRWNLSKCPLRSLINYFTVPYDIVSPIM